MNFLNSMLAAWGWGDTIEQAEASSGADWGWVSTLLTTMETVLWILLAVVGAAGAIYAIYVGVKMARADSAEAREENKKRLINIIVSIVVVVVLILFFNGFLPMILNAFGVFDKKDYGNKDTTGDDSLANIRTLANTAKVLLRV